MTLLLLDVATTPTRNALLIYRQPGTRCWHHVCNLGEPLISGTLEVVESKIKRKHTQHLFIKKRRAVSWKRAASRPTLPPQILVEHAARSSVQQIALATSIASTRVVSTTQKPCSIPCKDAISQRICHRTPHRMRQPVAALLRSRERAHRTDAKARRTTVISLCGIQAPRTRDNLSESPPGPRVARTC